MPLPKVIPALSDLTQDIAGPVPVQLLRDWATGAQDLASAESILSGFQIQGTVVSSDTSGLSKLTQAMDLLDVLSLISQPKEIIHALGRAIGGRSIGTWVADNTEMFYAGSLQPDLVVDAMSEARARIEERLQVRVGMCVHAGGYYEIGGGLYGTDADVVEYLAEQCAGPGEILLTPQVASRLTKRESDELALKTYNHEGSREEAYLLRSARRMPDLEETDTAYPHPFPEEFYRQLPHLHEPSEAERIKQEIYGKWLRECVVVFLARHREPQQTRSLAGLLDDLVINALMDTVLREVTPGADHIASSAGGIAILTFTDQREALDFVRVVRAKLAENGLAINVGIDAGPVLLFQSSRGPSGIAGDPINIASKLAEDVGRPDCISVTDRVARQMGNTAACERFSISISGVALNGVILT